tara:strand:+ start:902 stop:1096 length:195 start_codon:yes stop_codon:yes gene_type:complete
MPLSDEEKNNNLTIMTPTQRMGLAIKLEKDGVITPEEFNNKMNEIKEEYEAEVALLKQMGKEPE